MGDKENRLGGNHVSTRRRCRTIRSAGTKQEFEAHIAGRLAEAVAAMAAVAAAQPDPADLAPPATEEPTGGAALVAALRRSGRLPSPLVGALEVHGDELWMGYREDSWGLQRDGADYLVLDHLGDTVYRAVGLQAAWVRIRDGIPDGLQPERAVPAEVLAAFLLARGVRAEVEGRGVRVTGGGGRWAMAKPGRKAVWDVLDGSGVSVLRGGPMHWYSAAAEVELLASGKPVRPARPRTAADEQMLAAVRDLIARRRAGRPKPAPDPRPVVVRLPWRLPPLSPETDAEIRAASARLEAL